MSVPATDQATTPTVRRADAPAGAPARTPRRHGAASRHVGAAGQTRRNLQRDLARREASLRISRRVSGPAGGVARPPLADVPPQPLTAPAAPAALAPQAPVARPSGPAASPLPAPAPGIDLRLPAADLEVPTFVAAPVVRRTPRQAPAARGAAPQRPAAPQRGPAGQPRAVAQGPATRAAAVAARPVAVAAPAPALRARPLAAAASALAAAPARLPISLPQRPRLTVLPGGLVQEAPAGKRRVSTPAVMVTAITMVILTFGAILGLQISKTQVNEQMGADLSAIGALQQKVTATREKLNRASASANVDGAAASRGLFEPDLTDVKFTRVGERAAAAERAKRLLSKAPVAPTAAQRAAAEAKAKAETAEANAAAGLTGASTGVQDTSGSADTISAMPGTTDQAQAATGATTDVAGAGATQ